MPADYPERIGDYEIQGVIGKGAMGKVYKAVQPSLNRIVAIKVLPAEFQDDPDRVERFHREAQAVAMMSHPNVVQIIEKNQEGEELYFVMEYVPGTALAAVLKQRRLSLPEAFRVFRGVSRGLEAAHKQSIVHRDLSPRNILVSEDLSVVKLVDFGISRVETISLEQGTLSTSEFSMGSLHYMAPEQARDMVSADHRADIYSLGVLLYEMLTGRVPVGRFSLPSQLNSEVPPEVDPIVLKCLEAEPQSRYQSVGRLQTDIGRLEDQLKLGLVHEVRGIGTSTSKIFLKSGRKKAAQMAILAGAAVVLIGGAIYFAQSLGESSASEPTEPLLPVEVVEHERPELETAEEDPLSEALTDIEIPEADAAEAVEEPAAQPAPASRSTPTRPAGPSLAEDLLVARNKLEAGLYGEAQADLESLIAEHPDASETPKAYLLLGELHEKTQDRDKARATYVELKSRFQRGPEVAESLYRSAKLIASEGGRDRMREARDVLGELASTYRGSRWAEKALIDRAAIEEQAKWEVQDAELGVRVPASLVTYRDLVQQFPTTAAIEDSLWKLGEMYSDLKKFRLAAESFEALGTKVPTTRHEAWWRAGQLYDRRLDQPDKAVAAYQNVPKGSRRYNEAQRRINKLSKR